MTHSKNLKRVANWVAVLTILGCGTARLAIGAENSILHLKNGDRLSGQIVSTNEGKLIIETTLLGRVTVALDQVARREAVPAPVPPAGEAAAVAEPTAPAVAVPAPVEPKPAPAPVPTPDAVATPGATNATASAAPAVPAAPPAAAPGPPPKPKGPRRWKFDVQMGANLQYFQHDSESFYGRTKVDYARGALHHVFDYLLDYGNSDGRTVADRMEGISKLDYEISPKVFAYNLARVAYDKPRNIELEYEEGPGMGYHLLKKPKFVLDGELGGTFRHQDLTGGMERRQFFYRVSEKSVWSIISDLSFDQRVEFLQQAEDFDSYVLRLEGTLTYNMTKNLTLNLVLLNIYDSNPPSNLDENDLRIRSSIGVRF